MLDEGSGAMEKRLPSRQSQAQPKNNGVISEKKSDYLSNKNGRQRKQRDSNSGGRAPDPSQYTRPVQKYTRSFGDKRPRPRGYLQDRQGEEVAEGEELFDISVTNGSRKCNANHLLKFSYGTRSESGGYGRGPGGRSGYGRGQGMYRKTTVQRYKKEQFLQASCQFVVRDDGEYTEQAINPDALVNWDMIELVRTFSTEAVTCPICLQAPTAGKITKCGHTYCWACILHHLHEREMVGGEMKCPVCPHKITVDELKSVQCIEVPDYKIGDVIEMKLMRKSKGGVYVCPKAEWKERAGLPHNISDGNITQYGKLLLASSDQIQHEVIDPEKAALDIHLLDAEEYETCYIHMAKEMLASREQKLKMKISLSSQSESEKEDEKEASPDEEKAVEPLPPGVSFDGTKITTQYSDAFEDEEEETTKMSPSAETSAPSHEASSSMEMSSAGTLSDDAFLPAEDDSGLGHIEILPPQAHAFPEGSPFLSSEGSHVEDAADSTQPLGSPTLPLPFINQESGVPLALTPEEAADHLELPEASGGPVSDQRKNNGVRNKDTYYFYQASTGQHIYLNSLNAQCLTREYGSLENSPETITATIVAIERIFMTEDVRKRLRYLNHIPLTCEFHVVELKIKPPIISKETLRHFQPEFERRRRSRQKKAREEKVRAKEQEVEHKKSFGIYPEVQIPLDNLMQFPSHLANLPGVGTTQSGGTEGNSGHLEDRPASDILSDPGSEGAASGSLVGSPRSRNDSEGSQTGGVSFAEMLKAGKSIPQTGTWARVASQPTPALTTSATMPELRSPMARRGAIDEDEDGEYLPAPSIASSWFDGITQAMDRNSARQLSPDDTTVESSPASGGGKKKNKKKKEKQLLFSTSMARKN